MTQYNSTPIIRASSAHWWAVEKFLSVEMANSIIGIINGPGKRKNKVLETHLRRRLSPSILAFVSKACCDLNIQYGLIYIKRNPLKPWQSIIILLYWLGPSGLKYYAYYHDNVSHLLNIKYNPHLLRGFMLSRITDEMWVGRVQMKPL